MAWQNPVGLAEDGGEAERWVGSESTVMRRRPQRTRYWPLQPVVAKVVSVVTVMLSPPGESTLGPWSERWRVVVNCAVASLLLVPPGKAPPLGSAFAGIVVQASAL